MCGSVRREVSDGSRGDLNRYRWGFFFFFSFSLGIV